MAALLKLEAKASFDFFRPPKEFEKVTFGHCHESRADHFLFATNYYEHTFMVPFTRTADGYQLVAVDADTTSPGKISRGKLSLPSIPFKIRPILSGAREKKPWRDSDLSDLDAQEFSFWYSKKRIFAMPKGESFMLENQEKGFDGLVWDIVDISFAAFNKSEVVDTDDPNEATYGNVSLNRSKSDYTSFKFSMQDFLSSEAHLVGEDGNLICWLYKRRVFSSFDRDLAAEDIAALVNEDANKRRLQLEKAHAVEAMTRQLDSRAKRQSIPQDVKTAIWQRDNGRCVECESQVSLEFDHIIPFSMGGSNTVRNLQLLCETCNRRKGASLG
jgi:hypothetical protein